MKRNIQILCTAEGHAGTSSKLPNAPATPMAENGVKSWQHFLEIERHKSAILAAKIVGRRAASTAKSFRICPTSRHSILISIFLLLSTAALLANGQLSNNDTFVPGMPEVDETMQLLNASTAAPTEQPHGNTSSTPETTTLPNGVGNSTVSIEGPLVSVPMALRTLNFLSPLLGRKPHQLQDGNGSIITADDEPRHFQLFSLNWTHVQTPFCLALWLLLASIAKILFNLDKRVAEAVPDSALLIVLGLGVGCLLRVLGVDAHLFTLPSGTFFLYLLPPIIFDAGYFMPNRQLFENFDSVLLFAFCGTIWNTLAIGFSLLWMAHLCFFSVPFSAFQILLFASLISAVDPVAVIAVFEEIHINEFLFINVFGEALFNDGVSVVLYQMFRKFILIGEQNLLLMDFVAGVGSFFVIALGGVLIGLSFAVLAALATKYSTRVHILAPVFIFVIPFLAYLTAELFGLSSILAIVACGIGMKQYVKGNLSHDAYSSVKYFVKMLAQSSETVIFMFLGLSTVSSDHHWDWAFVGGTVGFCLLHRVIGVVVQCAVLNRFRTKKFSFSDQFVLSYGGLRGAIAFGLVVSLDKDIPARQMFITTTLAVIFFTVFIQGITIRPLLHLLHVEKQDMDKEETMIEKIYTRYCDYMMAGLEDIAGQKGKNSVRDGFERFNAKALKPVLMRGEQRKTFDTSTIVRAYTKITLLEAHRLARSSVRKRPSARVAPSPSSVSSTLTYSNCWTTMTTASANGHISGCTHSPSSPTAKLPTLKALEEGGNAASDGRPSSTHSTRSSADERVQPAELEQYLAQPENTEILYAMFSRLLDRKMAELRLRKGVTEEEEEDDIKDNYMDALILRPKSGATGQERRNRTADFLSPPLRNGGEHRRSDERRRYSLSPGIERQIGSIVVPPMSAVQMQGAIAARRLFNSEAAATTNGSEQSQPQQRLPRNRDVTTKQKDIP